MERDKNGYCGHAEISKGQRSFWEVAITKKHLNWGNRRQILQKKNWEGIIESMRWQSI